MTAMKPLPSDALQNLLGRHWHHLPATEVRQLLETNLDAGLDLFEVKHRQEQFGRNQLTPRKGRSAWMRFLLQFHNPLIYILLAAGGLKLAMGGFVDAAVILSVVLINAVIGYLQEAKAERAIEALSQSLVMETTVIRSGKTLRIPSPELAPGDSCCSPRAIKCPLTCVSWPRATSKSPKPRSPANPPRLKRTPICNWLRKRRSPTAPTWPTPRRS